MSKCIGDRESGSSAGRLAGVLQKESAPTPLAKKPADGVGAESWQILQLQPEERPCLTPGCMLPQRTTPIRSRWPFLKVYSVSAPFLMSPLLSKAILPVMPL